MAVGPSGSLPAACRAGFDQCCRSCWGLDPGVAVVHDEADDGGDDDGISDSSRLTFDCFCTCSVRHARRKRRGLFVAISPIRSARDCPRRLKKPSFLFSTTRQTRQQRLVRKRRPDPSQGNHAKCHERATQDRKPNNFVLPRHRPQFIADNAVAFFYGNRRPSCRIAHSS